jgi:hypothetical protein
LISPHESIYQKKKQSQDVDIKRRAEEGKYMIFIMNIQLRKTRFLTSTNQILMEIEQKSQFSSQQIQVVKAQMASKARENRMLQLTASEVGALPKETHIYEGVGKM